MTSNPCILYVEDDPTSREVMEMTLIYRLGYTKCFIFENSANFIDRLAALPERPDLVFLDIHMELSLYGR